MKIETVKTIEGHEVEKVADIIYLEASLYKTVKTVGNIDVYNYYVTRREQVVGKFASPAVLRYEEIR